jgi:hypothetical protein
VATAVLPLVNLSDGTSSSFNYSTSAVGGGGPVAIEDPAATVIYTPPGNLASMTVTVINHPDGTAEFLRYDLGGSGLITNGYDPTTGQLIITGSADPSVYQNVLRTITYENDSLTPDTSDRQIQFVVSDGTNSSVVRTATVSISAPTAPSGPARGFILNKGLQSEGSITGSQSLNNSVQPTVTDPLMNGLSLGLRSAGDDLAITLVTVPGSGRFGPLSTAFRLSYREARVPFDKVLALEAWAAQLALD